MSENAWKLYPATVPVGFFIQPNNPFYQSGISSTVYDNKPEDGWVLVKRDFGTPTRQVTPTPYLILYNKYQGLLRIFVFLLVQEGYNTGSIRLYADNSASSSVALTFLSNISWGRNDLDKVKNNNGAATTPVMNNSWAFADFPIAYDASITTKTNARFQFEVWGIENYNIDINGLGTVNQIMGQNSPANVSNSGFFQPGGLFDAVGKKISGTQETWTKWYSTIEKIGEKIPSNSPSPSLAGLKNWVNNVRNSWVVGNLGLIGAGVGLVDFLITGGRVTNKEQPAPMNFLLNFSLQGTMTTSDQTGAVTFPIPGANHNWSYPTDLLYTHPLGILNLTNSPVLQHRQYWLNSNKYHSYRVKNDLLFDFNQSSDLEITSIKAAYVFEILGSQMNTQLFLNFADQGNNSIDGTPIQLESYNNEKYIFRTPYMNANEFRYQKITLPEGGGFNLYVKIYAQLKVKNSSSNRQPVIFIATYDANVEEGDGVQAPWPEPFHATVTRSFEFDPDQTQPVQYNFIGQTINVTTPSSIGFYNFSIWNDGYGSPNRTVTSNFDGTAFYKYRQHSNSSNGYSTSSQRKFVKTDDGFLHYVYESMGKVWYELSTDGGTTWNIMNDGKPLGDGKNPSIDYRNNFVLIAFQVNGTIYVDCFSKNDYTNTYDLKDDIFVDEFVEGLDYSQNCYPVISIGGSEAQEGFFFIICWRIYQGETPNGPYGLYCKLGRVYPPNYTILWENNSQLIPGTNSTSQNQSMTVKKDYQVAYDLVWQQDRSINHITLTPNFSTHQIDFGTCTPISSTSGFTFNRYPSISLSSNNTPIISWVGSNGSGIEKVLGKEEGGSYDQVFKTVVKNGINGNYFNGGNNVNYVNSNSPTSGDYTVVIWSEGSSPISKFVTRHGSSYNATTNLSHSGIQNQVSNGSTVYSIKAMVFNTQSSPYTFTFVNDNFGAESGGGGIGKITDDLNLTYGRSGIVGKNGVQFVFNIGDIILADTNVQFIPRPDTILYTNTEELNQVTRSLTFHLDNQSDLYFTNFYYTANGDYADSALTIDDAVTFKVELVNAITNEIIGTYDQITYTKENLEEYDNINYKVDCSGIDPGDYYLRLVTSVIGNADYNLANVQNDDPNLEKRNYQNINFTGRDYPTTYDLTQNYPNPFNPSTTINYQLPKNGFVTLRVYDILGREVATLVNEQKNQGRYSVNFNASKLSSGVYIYQIRANDFVSSKKMMLVK